MPELPDLVYIQKHLADFLPGKRITAVEIKEPIVLRALIPEGFEDGLKHACFQKVYRHGPFLTFIFDGDLDLVIHPMLAGKFKIAESADKPGRSMCFSLHLDDGSYFNYLDDKKMGKVYLTESGEYDKIPRYMQQGINILNKEFTLQAFQKLIAKQRKQVRVFLMDQTRISAIGNAYADEILFDAGLHPLADDEDNQDIDHRIPENQEPGIREQSGKHRAGGVSVDTIKRTGRGLDEVVDGPARQHRVIRENDKTAEDAEITYEAPAGTAAAFIGNIGDAL